MKAQKRFAKQNERRKFRVRNSVQRSAKGRPRLSVFRSNNHIYAQLIDDVGGQTIAWANTLEKDLYGPSKYAGNVEAATRVGELIASRALEKGVKAVIFDRGPYQYHGRVAALADAARKAGLEF